jgi:hypothetical protein
VFRPPLKVALPRDWLGTLARSGIVIVSGLLLIGVLLGTIPKPWVEWVGGFPELIRLAGGLLVLWVMSWVAALVYSRHPRAPFLLGKTLRIYERSERRRIDVAEIADIHVELRPPPMVEAFVVELRDGSIHELCPVRWRGAGQLYVALARRLGRSRES